MIDARFGADQPQDVAEANVGGGAGGDLVATPEHRHELQAEADGSAELLDGPAADLVRADAHVGGFEVDVEGIRVGDLGPDHLTRLLDEPVDVRAHDDDVAVLDPRLATTKSYRWELIRALPPFARTKDRAEVHDFLRRLDAGS